MKLVRLIAFVVKTVLLVLTCWHLFTVNINDYLAIATYITWYLVIDGIVYNIQRFVDWKNKKR